MGEENVFVFSIWFTFVPEGMPKVTREELLTTFNPGPQFSCFNAIQICDRYKKYGVVRVFGTQGFGADEYNAKISAGGPHFTTIEQFAVEGGMYDGHMWTQTKD